MIPESVIHIYHKLIDYHDEKVKNICFDLYMKGIKKHEYYLRDNILCFIEREIYEKRTIFNEHTKSIVEFLSLYASKEYQFKNLLNTMSVIEELFVQYRSIEIIELMKHAIRINEYTVEFKVLPLLIEIVNNFMESKERKKLALE